MAAFEIALGAGAFEPSAFINDLSSIQASRPREITTGEVLQLVDIASFFNTPYSSYEGKGRFVFSQSKNLLISQLRELRNPKMWLLHRVRQPKRIVIKGAEQFIQSVPYDSMLRGFVVANYGNGTVAMYKHSSTSDISINIGASALSYVVVDNKRNVIMHSGQSNIYDLKSLQSVFKIL